MEVSFGAKYIGEAGVYSKKAMTSNKKGVAMLQKHEGWTSQKDLAAGEPGQAPDALGCMQHEQHADHAMEPAQKHMDAGGGKEMKKEVKMRWMGVWPKLLFWKGTGDAQI